MACKSPLRAYRDSRGGISFSAKAGGAPFLLACGRCSGCRLERSRQWAIRCVHEAKMHRHNCSITLTYDEEHLPVDGFLDHRHFQLFMKRLRNAFAVRFRNPDTGRWKRSYPQIGFYMCGEYGEDRGRPHYHACLFGVDFPDKKLYKKSGSGFDLYSSEILNKAWGMGNCLVGDMNFETAAYCARYIMKKLLGKDVVKKIDSRFSVDLLSGEVFVPEYTHMSLKSPIGKSFYQKFNAEIFPHDRVVIRGKESLPPRYYARLYKRVDPDSWEDVMRRRGRFSVAGEGSPDRLRQKGICIDARIGRLVRNKF